MVWNRQVALFGKQVEMVGKHMGRARLCQSNSSTQAGTYDKWEDVEPTWAEPLAQALRDGVRTIRLSHSYQNKFGEANTRSTR